jgi:hypothetical protein
MTKLLLSYIIGLLQNIQDALDRGVTLEEIDHAIVNLKPEPANVRRTVHG